MQCQICTKPNHIAIKCWHRFDHSYTSEGILEALAALNITYNKDQNSYIDFEATSHMMSDRDKVSNIHPYDGSDDIFVGNGNCLKFHILVTIK